MTPASLDTARTALSFLSPDDRDEWIRMGMALKAEFGEDARDLWLEWGANSDRFDAKAAAASWRSFKQGGKIGIGSLFAAAKDRGFQFDKPTEPVSAEQLAADAAARAERATKAEADRQARALAACKRAVSQWRMAAPRGESPYLARKQVAAEACRYEADGAIIIPMVRYDLQPPALVGKQLIKADGEKRFSGGMDRSGAACRLGDEPLDGDDIGIGEGYATCLTLRMATEHRLTVFVAFDAGGLAGAARVLRQLYPSSRLVFFADDDYLTGGKGLAKANAAAGEVGNASVVLPIFTAARRETKKDDTLPALTDFNDLHVAESLDIVRAQVQAGLAQAPAIAGTSLDSGEIPAHFDEAAPPTPPAEGDPAGVGIPTLEKLLDHFCLIYPTTDVWDTLRKQRLKKSGFTAWVGKELAASWEKDPKRRTIARESLPTLIGGRAVDGGGGGGKLGEMLDNLTLLRGTETVWDAIGQQVMSLGAVRADYTAELTSKWQEHSLRKTIEARNLVFDPTQQADPVSHVNIFLGWPLTPKSNADLLGPILALLESLCGAEDNVDDCVVWILRWLAYPLQHPGAKMQTALLMFGEKQGTGKSLFFQDVILPIFGEYGTVASQHQLDSSFTAWRSRKLFVLFEEVLSRDDKYSHNGTLKYMITGKSMSINQKNLPERDERNHMNSVFLSNEPQPIPIELEDRRFMVIEARKKQAQEFYDAVSASIDKGGIEAFYHFLLTFPLDGFNEHTKPPMTLAKERVIEFGLNGWMSFHRAWKDGYLAAPYCSCLSEDLYIMYRRWCDKSGEKPLTLCKFAGLIASREHKVKRNVAVGKKGKTTRMIFEIKNPDEKDSVEQQIERFRDLGDIRADGALQG
ncbi:PriCT-2 domain-containing protein [Massilia sp. GCM10020059]|uniref:PriCT-2 domain-containing protein n=1 Tax=Massilia agrisoli TaxID=2892444 RepID=A0ABS8IUP7_9BURK|nr:PriCT-2 domain-containing protein [Massilia agrisoli]MCC6071443.1 PriCT-2 domain-containing protein [Massilia agrisoli]